MLTTRNQTARKVKSFDEHLPKSILNVENKTRSSVFPWRGQFHPQLIEHILLSYCPEGAVVVDPFVGSGTVLHEASCLGLQAIGYEVNPAAWIMSRVFKLTNVERDLRRELTDKIKSCIFSNFELSSSRDIINEPIDIEFFKESYSQLHSKVISIEESILLEALVVLLNLDRNHLTKEHLLFTVQKICQIVNKLPFSSAPINSELSDARAIPLEDKSIDFILTSPPYINVFNYHQNYRKSTEILGWDLLKIARSEIGSNRANRGNRFLTVIQYCLDIAKVLIELHRISKSDGKILLIVGHESNVLGVPFLNAEIIRDIAIGAGVFALDLQQERIFTNKFGKNIRESLLHFSVLNGTQSISEWDRLARDVASRVLFKGIQDVTSANKKFLELAISRIPDLQGTPLYCNGTIQGKYRVTLL